MKRTVYSLSIGCLSLLALACLHAPAHAQFNPYQRFYQNQLAQQNWQIQQMMNAQAGQVFGTNYGIPIYASTVANYYGLNNPWAYRPYAPVVPPIGVAAAMDPYGAGMANPYSPAGAGYGIANPYSPGGIGGVGGVGGVGGINPLNPYNPYLFPGLGLGGPGFGEGQMLMGSADVMRAYGSVINQQETARILRQQAEQAKLETRKKAFDLEMYIKANTPTYTQEQERIAKNTLRRIQTHSLPGEVVNGKSLNYLLDDLRKFPNKKIALEPISLSEGVLTNLNVTKTTFGLGILREDGRVSWPVALQERMSVKQRKDLDEQLKDLVKNAYRGQLDANVLSNVRAETDKMREDLGKRVNDIPTPQYMDAKRFLQEFSEACTALEKGEAPIQAKFQRFIEGGKSVQEVVDYMVSTGLRFAPATAADEPAYRAVHAALATYDIAMNSALGIDTKD